MGVALHRFRGTGFVKLEGSSTLWLLLGCAEHGCFMGTVQESQKEAVRQAHDSRVQSKDQFDSGPFILSPSRDLPKLPSLNSNGSPCKPYTPSLPSMGYTGSWDSWRDPFPARSFQKLVAFGGPGNKNADLCCRFILGPPYGKKLPFAPSYGGCKKSCITLDPRNTAVIGV